MRINYAKAVKIVSGLFGFALTFLPALAFAQFRFPNAASTNLPNGTTASDFIIDIINILLAIAGLLAVIFLIIGGFRYITAGGNEEAAESGKKTIINAVIGLVVVILSFVIVRVIANALINDSAV